MAEQKKSSFQLILGLVALVGILILGYFFLDNFSSTKGPQEDQPVTEHDKALERVRAQTDKDQETLDQHESGQPIKDLEFYGALIRVAQLSDHRARSIALDQKNNKSSLVRQAVAQALGHFNDPQSLETLKKLTADPDPKVRRFALEAFGTKPDPAREKILKELSQNQISTPKEVLATYASLYQTQQDSEKKKTSLDKILTLTRGSDTEVAADAVRKLIQIAPESKQVLSAVQNAVHKNFQIQLTALGIRFLSNKRDPWITKNLTRLSKNKSSKIRMAVIQSLHRSCPKNRWDLLQTLIVNETDNSVADLALKETLLMPGKRSSQFLEGLLKNHQLPEPRRKMAQNTLSKLGKTNQVNPCR